MEHEALLGFAFKAFEALHIVAGSEGCCDQCLSFATSKDGGAVRAWKDAGFDPDFSNLVEGASIGTALMVNHMLAKDALAEDLEVMLEVRLRFLIVFRNLGQESLLEFLDQRVALRLGMFLGVEPVGQVRAHAFLQVVVISLIELRWLDGALGFADFLPEFADSRAYLLDLGMAELDGVHHRLFLYFLGAGFDHHDGISGADHHDVDQTFAHFVVSRIHNELAIHQSDAHRTDRTEEWNVRKGESGRRAVDATDVGVVIGIGRQNERDDLSFALEAFGKHRPDGAVNLATGENFALTHTPFALDEAAGDASAGIGVLAIVNSKGKEVDALARIGVGDRRGEDNVFADAHNGGPMGLLGQFSGFK